MECLYTALLYPVKEMRRQSKLENASHSVSNLAQQKSLLKLCL